MRRHPNNTTHTHQRHTHKPAPGAQDAARLRDQIKELEELNKPQPPDMSGLSTSSDTLTDGVRVRVRRCAAARPGARPGAARCLLVASCSPLTADRAEQQATMCSTATNNTRGVPAQPRAAAGSLHHPAACMTRSHMLFDSHAFALSPLILHSYYVPAQSRPELGQYFFAYSITITNEGQRVVMLNSRHWLITDGSGKVDHVRCGTPVGRLLARLQRVLANTRTMHA